MNAFPLRWGIGKDDLFSIVLKVLSAVRQVKGKKGTQIKKEERKLPLYADSMIAYVENPEESTIKS